MAFLDYYKILGINQNATEQEIKKAYRKQARKYHPDVNPNDPEAQRKFQEINEANEVLSNPENRKKYDQYGKDWKHADDIERAKQQQQYQRQAGQQDFGGFGGEASGYSDFFESMFGGGRGGVLDTREPGVKVCEKGGFLRETHTDYEFRETISR